MARDTANRQTIPTVPELSLNVKRRWPKYATRIAATRLKADEDHSGKCMKSKKLLSSKYTSAEEPPTDANRINSSNLYLLTKLFPG